MWSTIKSLRHYRNVGHYLGARMLFNDGMTAVLTFGGIYAAGTFHWGALTMIVYGLELSVFAVVGGFFAGWLDNRFGSKRALFVSVGGTLFFFAAGLTMAPDRIFWVIPYDLHAAPINGLPFLQHLAGGDLSLHRQRRRDVHQRRLRQCAHDDGQAARAAGEDDGVLRPDVAVGHVDRRSSPMFR